MSVVQLELDVLDDEGPDFVAEAIRVEVSLWWSVNTSLSSWQLRRSYLERHPSFHLLAQHCGDALVEVLEDAHG